MKKVLVKLDNVSKKFKDKYVIKTLSLDIYEGEFLTLLGPSGCGKTTVLRMISGLDSVTEGKVYIDDVDVTNTPPAERLVNTIFQNFALFPHMTVWDNINFGLKMHKVDSAESTKRIKKAIKLVKLEGFENRYPIELSGGQQQRVAIARGIVMNHKILLLDESLCSLDLKLKREMQIELKKLQKKLGITFIYVTHDQDEALTMSDRIAIINNGTIEQLDTPRNIYRKPKTQFVADFIGESNILKCNVVKSLKGVLTLELSDKTRIDIKNKNYKKGDKLTIILRPEIFKIKKKETKNSIPVIITNYVYDGSIVKLEVKTLKKDPIELKVCLLDSTTLTYGDTIYLTIQEDKLIILGDES